MLTEITGLREFSVINYEETNIASNLFNDINNMQNL